MSTVALPKFLLEDAIRAKRFSDVRKIAQESLEPFEGEAEVVCGTIDGGYGRVTANLLMLQHAQTVLSSSGYRVWNHIPVMGALIALRVAFMERYKRAVYAHPEHDDVYRPLYSLKPPLIKRVWLLWDKEVFGKSYELEWHALQCKVSGIETKVFDPAWHCGGMPPKPEDL